MAIRPISRSRPAQATPTLSTFAELIKAGYLEQRDIDGVYLDPTPAMSTTVLSLAAAVRFSTAPLKRFAADKPAGFR